jgi:hypothetical protein
MSPPLAHAWPRSARLSDANASRRGLRARNVPSLGVGERVGRVRRAQALALVAHVRWRGALRAMPIRRLVPGGSDTSAYADYTLVS